MSKVLENNSNPVAISSEIKDVILASPFLALVSLSRSGQPHLIVVGKVKEIRDATHLVFGVYKMEKTQENLAETGFLQVAAVSAQIGYRFSGRAVAQKDEIIFEVQQIAKLL